MTDQVDDILNQLVSAISQMEQVGAIGLSGGKQSLAAGSDLDLFIYCSSIPSKSHRKAALDSLGAILDDRTIGVMEGGPWGYADHTILEGMETWLMYFEIEKTRQELDLVLQGELPERQEGGYYPIGRCATLMNMVSLYDSHGWLAEFKQQVSTYPADLSEKLVSYHLDQLADREDLERAVQREDVLFYHFALDIALDNFLQALFALNREYFPSRKRSLQYIRNFRHKPAACEKRLLDIVLLGGQPNKLANSYETWDALVRDLNQLYKKML
jgi:hypothetical protein